MRKALRLHSKTLRLLGVGSLAGLAFAHLLPTNTPIPLAGDLGAPHRSLDAAEQATFLRGRDLFDRDWGHGAGVGPVFNGDSCRGCHQDPVIGGAGGIDVQVQRPMVSDGGSGFMSPNETGALAQTHQRVGVDREEIPVNVIFVEERNSPTLLGLGLIQSISDATILANEDPTDADGDKIKGVAHMLPGNVIGRFGWKAGVPTVRAFVRDALGNEMGITVPTGGAFGIQADSDGVPDPEISDAETDDLAFFIRLLDFPPITSTDATGEALFTSIGCAECHVPVMDGVALYSNLLLHNVLPPSFLGITEGAAGSGFYRTSPLRGLAQTAPYFHDGRSETINDAILRHAGESIDVTAAYVALSAEDKAALIRFLETR